MYTEEEFTQAVSAEHARILNWLNSMWPDHHACEDALQQSYLHVWQRLDRLTWPLENILYWSAKQRLVDYIRLKGTTFRGGALPLEEALAVAIDDFTIACERKEAITCVLSVLSDCELQVMLLFAKGIKLREIAEQLGIPLNTVKSRMNYARQRLERIKHVV